MAATLNWSPERWDGISAWRRTATTPHGTYWIISYKKTGRNAVQFYPPPNRAAKRAVDVHGAAVSLGVFGTIDEAMRAAQAHAA